MKFRNRHTVIPGLYPKGRLRAPDIQSIKIPLKANIIEMDSGVRQSLIHKLARNSTTTLSNNEWNHHPPFYWRMPVSSKKSHSFVLLAGVYARRGASTRLVLSIELTGCWHAPARRGVNIGTPLHGVTAFVYKRQAFAGMTRN